eukprot:scaffold4475_cov42-Attheya_sp.AAC.3
MSCLTVHDNLGGKLAVEIGCIIEHDDTVLELVLTKRAVGLEGSRSIASALLSNSTLRILCLGGTQIGDFGVMAIAAALKGNSTLEDLHLQGNRIHSEGATAIASTLEYNSSLKKINLSHNSICNKGAVALASAFGKNSTLTHVYLDMNYIGREGRLAIAGVFPRSQYPIAVVKFLNNDSSVCRLMERSREVNQNRLVEKVVRNEIPYVLFPRAAVYLSERQQHLSKLFAILRERPDLLLL